MIMERIVRTILITLIAMDGYAQAVVPSNIRATNTLEKLFDYNGIDEGDILYGIPLPEGKVLGDTYLDTLWRNANILLYDKEKLIEGYPVRYDIYLDELEIKGKNGIKVLTGNKIKSFVWMDYFTNSPVYFINGKAFRNESDVPFTGFLQVLSEGPVPLLKRTYIDIKKADYNIALNVGSRDDKILKKNKFYALMNDKVIELPGSRKKFVSLFNDDKLEEFIRDNNLTTSKEEHLQIIFDHYNSTN
jgi:hypothetical protein